MSGWCGFWRRPWRKGRDGGLGRRFLCGWNGRWGSEGFRSAGSWLVCRAWSPRPVLANIEVKYPGFDAYDLEPSLVPAMSSPSAVASFPGVTVPIGSKPLPESRFVDANTMEWEACRRFHGVVERLVNTWVSLPPFESVAMILNGKFSRSVAIHISYFISSATGVLRMQVLLFLKVGTKLRSAI